MNRSSALIKCVAILRRQTPMFLHLIVKKYNRGFGEVLILWCIRMYFKFAENYCALKRTLIENIFFMECQEVLQFLFYFSLAHGMTKKNIYKNKYNYHSLWKKNC